MCSATWPPDVQQLAERYMTDPIQVYVGSLDLTVSEKEKNFMSSLFMIHLD